LRPSDSRPYAVSRRIGIGKRDCNWYEEKIHFIDEQTFFFNFSIKDAEYPYSPVTNQMWERGRARLQNYLKEIGWTETIIDVRSKCTRNLLKLGNAEQEENINPNVNGGEGNNKRASESQGNIDEY
jgi:hypothetical protein